MISIIDTRYVVQLPEYGVYQDIDPATGKPFADEDAATAWSNEFMATVKAQQQAQEAEHQAQLAQKLIVTITPSTTRMAVGDTVTIDVLIENGLGQVAPINDDFAVPITNERGQVVMIKHAIIKSGKATLSVVPKSSGYYCITSEGINHGYPVVPWFDLVEPSEITVFE